MNEWRSFLFWPLIGCITAIIAGYATAPLWRDHKKTAIAVVLLLPALGVGLYLWGGNPELIR